MINLLTSPIFYILLTIGLYSLFHTLYKKVKFVLLHPLVLTGVLLILYIFLISSITNKEVIDHLKEYNTSVQIVNIMLGPLTVVLALPIYQNWKTLKKHWLPVLITTIVGSIVSLLSVYLLGKLFKLDYTLIISLLPKSVTTAIAQEISVNIGGIPEITIAAVIFTGLLGALLGPTLTKLFRFKDSVSSGMAFGAASHAVGTSKAMEISKEVGAISSIAIATSGILTMIITLFI